MFDRLLGRRGLFLFRIFFSLAIIALVASRIDTGDFSRVVLGARWGILVTAFVLSPLVIMLLAARFKILLRAQGIEVSFRRSLRITWTGQFLNTFLPGSAGGDVWKVLNFRGGPAGTMPRATAGIVLDRFLALFALAILAFGALLRDPRPIVQLLRAGVPNARAFEILGAAILTVTVLLMIAARFRAGNSRLAAFLTKTSDSIKTCWRQIQFSPAVAAAFALALLTHLANFFLVFLLARALNINLSYNEVLLIMPAVLLVVFLPISINGHGLREMALVAYFTVLGVTSSDGQAHDCRQLAIALSAALVLNDFLCSMPGGILQMLTARKLSEAVPANAYAR